jgi:hypothetical protein
MSRKCPFVSYTPSALQQLIFEVVKYYYITEAQVNILFSFSFLFQFQVLVA